MSDYFVPWLTLAHQPGMQNAWGEVIDNVRSYLPRARKGYQNTLRQALLSKGLVTPERISIPALQKALKQLNEQSKIDDEELAKALMLVWSDGHRAQINEFVSGLKGAGILKGNCIFTPELTARGINSLFGSEFGSLNTDVVTNIDANGEEIDERADVRMLIWLCAATLFSEKTNLIPESDSTPETSNTMLSRGIQMRAATPEAIAEPAKSGQPEATTVNTALSPAQAPEDKEVTEEEIKKGWEAIEAQLQEPVDWSYGMARRFVAMWTKSVDDAHAKLAAQHEEMGRQIAQGSLTRIIEVQMAFSQAIKEVYTNLIYISSRDVESLNQWLKQAMAARNDWSIPSPSLKLDMEVKPVLNSQQMFARATACVDKLEEYDKSRAEAYRQWQAQRNEWEKLRSDLATLTGEEKRAPSPTAGALSASDQISVIQSACATLQAQIKQMQKEFTAVRATCVQTILLHAAHLGELGMSGDEVLAKQVKLATVDESHLARWSAATLAAVAAAAEQEVATRERERAQISAAALAGHLRHQWRAETLLALLDRLARDGRNEEIFLLVSALALADEERVPLPDNSLRALLEGAASLAAPQQGSQLLNLLFSVLETSWKPASPTAAARWGVILLHAQFAGSANLPKEPLWLTMQEWPDVQMPTWRLLWEKFLMDQPFVVCSDAVAQQQHELVGEARHAAEQFLVQERGLYAKARSDSARLARLLNKVLLPWYDRRLKELQSLEKKLEAASAIANPTPIAALRDEGARLVADLSEEVAYQRFEECVVSEGSNDSSPRQRRSALHVVTDCASVLSAYAEALVSVASARLADTDSFSLETLQAEVQQHFRSDIAASELNIATLTNTAGTERTTRDETAALREGVAIVEESLLSRPQLVRRLPTVAAELASRRLDWGRLWSHLLADIAEPPGSVLDVVETLLAMHAPNQVLYFANEIDAKQLQQAQQRDDQLNRKAATLYADLLEMGGQHASWPHDSKCGRWQLLQSELNAQLEQHREQRRQVEAQRQERVAVLFRKTQELQSLLFQKRGEMPPSSFDSTLRGLQQAQLAATSSLQATEEHFAAIDNYCEQILYQAEHDSWPIDKMTGLALQLSSALSQSNTERGTLDSAQVLALLERRDLAELGLSPALFDESRIETRSELLHQWLRILVGKKLLTDEMSAPERTTVQKLIQKFALMTQLAQVFGQDNRHIVVSQPVYYGVYRLKLPKSPSLERNCVVMAVPGNPPEPAQIGLVESLLDDNQWLDDRFVLLLMPGATPKLRERLERGRRNAGLVIVDDSTLTRMVLAEREQRRAVGVLRSIMINAQDAANTEVFRVEKAVEPRTGIFVGREDLIRQVVDGTNNVALYGGRRIGKSSILSVAYDRLAQREHVQIVQHSFEGGRSVWHDDAVAKEVARQLGLDGVVDLQTLTVALHERLAGDPDLRVVLLFDEIDRYIKSTQTRHLLIETLRALSDRHGDRLRIVVAGFMSLYDCLNGRGPYSGADDPWGRMFHDAGPVPNLKPEHAEEIVREGFWEVLGWRFESSMIPQLIVERTGGHPDFVQHFCSKLQERVAARGDQTIRREDVKAVFFDDDPSYSFVAHVRKTLKMNLDPVAHLLILLIADRARESRRLTFEQFAEVARLSRVEIPRQTIEVSLRRLQVTSVVNETKASMYEFAVPDYPLILSRLEETRHVAELEDEVETVLRA